MTERTADKHTHVQRLMHDHDRALRTSAGGQQDLPFEDVETRTGGIHATGGEAVACMFADEFRVLEMRREAR